MYYFFWAISGMTRKVYITNPNWKVDCNLHDLFAQFSYFLYIPFSQFFLTKKCKVQLSSYNNVCFPQLPLRNVVSFSEGPLQWYSIWIVLKQTLSKLILLVHSSGQSNMMDLFYFIFSQAWWWNCGGTWGRYIKEQKASKYKDILFHSFL